MKPLENSSVQLETMIRDFIDHSAENDLQDQGHSRAFATPLVGFSNGADPVFDSFKEHVGPFHWTPWEIFTQSFPALKVRPEDLTVISWILPITEAVKTDNRKESIYPAEGWARARIYGEEVNVKLRKHVVAGLLEAGHEAVSPLISPLWGRKVSERFGLASTWSERHAAFASGLGTFGLCDGLITPVGKAMRVGSVVARIQIAPTPRPYSDHREYCLFATHGLCGKCIPRCPVGAITSEGHDKEKCRKHLKPVTEDYVRTHYGFEGYGCGLCQTAVPCESKIPRKSDLDEA